MSKTVTCKRCGKGSLRWAQTKAGKWYLTPIEGHKVHGDDGRHIKTLALAHRCPTPEQVRNEARDLRYEELVQEFGMGKYGTHDKAIAQVKAELGDWEW